MAPSHQLRDRVSFFFLQMTTILKIFQCILSCALFTLFCLLVCALCAKRQALDCQEIALPCGCTPHRTVRVFWLLHSLTSPQGWGWTPCHALNPLLKRASIQLSGMGLDTLPALNPLLKMSFRLAFYGCQSFLLVSLFIFSLVFALPCLFVRHL